MFRLRVFSLVFISFFCVFSFWGDVNYDFEDIEIDDEYEVSSNSIESNYSLVPPSLSPKGDPPFYPLTINLEFLYLKPIEDNTRYGLSGVADALVNIPVQVPFPSTLSIDQELEYCPAFRLETLFPLYDHWGGEAAWTRLRHQFPKTKASDPTGHLFASYVASFLGESSVRSSYIEGQWTLCSDAFNFEFQRPFILSKSLELNPIFGIQGFLIQQKFNVFYVLLDTFNEDILTPQAVLEKIRSWGVGPEIGSEIKMLIPGKWTLFCKGTFSLMAGKYKVNTSYPHLINYGEYPPYLLKDDKRRLFTMAYLKAGLSKWWEWKNHGSVEFALGWETQIWFHQQVSNFFSTLPLQSSSDLSFWGPFAGLSVRF